MTGTGIEDTVLVCLVLIDVVQDASVSCVSMGVHCGCDPMRRRHVTTNSLRWKPQRQLMEARLTAHPL